MNSLHQNQTYLHTSSLKEFPGAFCIVEAKSSLSYFSNKHCWNDISFVSSSKTFSSIEACSSILSISHVDWAKSNFFSSNWGALASNVDLTNVEKLNDHLDNCPIAVHGHLKINNDITRVIHQITICFSLLEKASVLFIRPRINHIIVITAHTAKINSHNSFVIKANVNRGWITHINHRIIIHIHINVVVLRQNHTIIKAKITASINAVTFAIIAKENNQYEFIFY